MVGGAIAKLLLKQIGVQVNAFVSRVGEVQLEKSYQELDFSKIESNIVRCPDQETAEKMIARIEEAGRNRDTVGGLITGVVKGVPAGWGEPVFNKIAC